MVKNSLKYIKNYLEDNRRLEPLPTDQKKIIKKLPQIKLVLFDIYGTLLISASGDIDLTNFSQEHINKAFDDDDIAIHCHSDKIINTFKTIIKEMHDKSQYPHPEVNYLEVSKELIYRLAKEKAISYQKEPDYKKFILLFELLNNPVAPMPGLKNIIKYLKNKNYTLGIISNAQFYTPICLNYFLNDKLIENENIDPFEADLTIYSYQLLRAKPDTYLYELINQKLKNYNILPSEVLYIGNDKLNDILPAYKVGFKTSLFAGDRRSLRLRKNHPEASKVKADTVITSLKDLQEIL